MDTSGGNYNILHNFSGWDEGDGGYPNGSLILDSGMLYGMTYDGGPGGQGTIFSMDKYGNSFNVLHAFGGGDTDGGHPYGSLILASGKLYGMTSGGGFLGYGTVFSIDTNGDNFTIMHDIGGSPHGSLVIGGDKFYGMTYGNYGSNPVEYGTGFYMDAPAGGGGPTGGGGDEGGNGGGPVPEPATVFTILGGLFMAGYRKVFKRVKKG
jgi:uncharacterized repeat protein (TIGR03803 family)